ncbi:MAG TPA: hypothetical protein VHN14_22855 [Kofleriaceae bacterium]|jgi:hypothetical protein|nr:hypothetical protein [Kofleriaceae bacterium]
MTDRTKQKMPKATRISRKLPLVSEKLVVMSNPDGSDNVAKCTMLGTGCPAHTC